MNHPHPLDRAKRCNPAYALNIRSPFLSGRILLVLLALTLFFQASFAQSRNKREADRKMHEQTVISSYQNAAFFDIPWLVLFNDGELSWKVVETLFNQKVEGIDLQKVDKKLYGKWMFYKSSKMSELKEDGSFPYQDEALEELRQFKKGAQQRVSAAANFKYIGQTASVFNSNNGRIERVNFHPTNPNIIWASAPSGGLWRSNDGGVNWSQIDDFWDHLSVGDLVYNTNNTNILYVATDDPDSGFNTNRGILRSDDGGNTWNIVGLPYSQAQNINKLAMHPDGSTLLACTNQGLFKSVNHGVTWTKNTALPINADVNDLEFKPGSTQVIYVTTRGGGSPNYTYFYVSTDGGATFTQQTAPMNSKGRTVQVCVSPNNPDVAFIGIYPEPPNYTTQGGMVMKYVHSTGQITVVTDVNYTFPYIWVGGAWDFRIELDPANAEHIRYGSVFTYESMDGGATWTYVPSLHADVHDIKWQPGTSKQWIANDGGLEYSTNGGSSWSPIQNIPVSQFYSVRSSRYGKYKILGAQDAGVHIDFNGNWQLPIGGDGQDVRVDPVDSTTMYGAIQAGLNMERVEYYPPSQTLVHTTIMNNALGGGVGATWRQKILIDAADRNILFTNYQDIFKSTNQGLSWTNLTNGSLGNGTVAITYLYQSKSDPNILVAGWNDQMRRSTNGGASWSAITHPGIYVGDHSALIISPTDPNKMWACGSGQVKKTTNGGASWTNYTGALPAAGVTNIAYQEGTADGLYVGGQYGNVYYRDDNTGDWVSHRTNLPNVDVSEIEVLPHAGKLRVSTWGRGVWESPLYTSSTNICTEPVPPAIQQFVCAGSVNLTIPAAPSGYSIVWDKDGSLVSGQTSTTLNATASGTYRARYLQNSGACHSYFSESTALTFSNGAVVGLYVDFDQDGFGVFGTPASCGPSATNSLDCNDNDAAIHPYATEICGNSIDEDCDGNKDVEVNKALHFNGSGHSITIPNVAHQSAFTVEMWIKTATAGFQNLVQWTGESPTAIFALSGSSLIAYIEGGGGFHNGSNIADGQWHHVALVHNGYTGTNIRAYVDGVERLSASLGNTIANTGTIIGNGFNGNIDDVRFWNVALTPDEIQFRMNRRLDGNEANLVRYYTFDHGKPGMDNRGLTIARDKTSNNAHGTLNGFALTDATSNWVSSWTYPTLYADADGDGFAGSAWTCGTMTGFVTNDLDCNDANAAINPYAEEICGNGVDDNCDGQTDVLVQNALNVASSGSNRVVLPLLAHSEFFTVEAWVKAPMGSAFRNIVSWDGPSSSCQICIYYNGQPGYFENDNGNLSGNRVDDDEWHHIAVVHNGYGPNNITLYRDGVSVLDIQRSNIINASSLTLGANASGGNLLGGTLDEVRFWNTARTQTEIQLNMSTELTGNEIGLVRYYKMNNRTLSGNNAPLTSLRDKTSNAAHGTLTNFTFSSNSSNYVAGNNAITSQGQTTFYADSDGDGYGNLLVTQTACSKPSGYVLNNTDCNDGNINEHPGQTWYIDADNDSYGGSSMTQCTRPMSGKLLSELASGSTGTDDCNDNNPAIHSDAIKINVRGKNTNINDGDGTPSVDDDTQFGSQSVCLGSVEKIYTIQNIGTSALTISGLTLSGTNAGDFKVSDLTSTTVAGSASVTFKVTFDPSGIGTRNATVIITYDDCDEASYDFAIQGTGVNPEINVKGNGVDITNGGTSPSPANHTNFGSTTGAPITRTFTIENLGHADLYLADGSITLVGTNANLFSVGNITLPKTVNGPSGTITFDVTYEPGANVGTHTATVNILSNDCNKKTYSFDVSGTRVCVAPSFIACPTDPITATTCAGQASCIYTVTADGTPTPTLTYAFTGATVFSGNGTGSGLSFNKGNTTVTVTASRTCTPATATCTFTVTVRDNEAPTITCAAPVTINTTAGLCTGTTTLANPTATDNCPGGIGLSFDGDNDEVTTKVSFAVNANATIEAWINPSVTKDNMRIISNTSGTTSGVTLRLQEGKLQFWGTCVTWQNISNTIIPANQWTHIAVVINGSQITGFINGAKGLTVTCSNTQIIELGMGGTFFNNGLYYKGKMDEVRFWNVARTDMEIASNMNVSISAQPNLVGLYHLNQGIAGGMNMGLTTAIDDSGNGNNGKLLNFELNNLPSNWVEGYVGVSYTNNAPATYPTGTTTVTWTATDASGNTAICNQTVTVNGAKINVKGNGTTIADGNTTPSTTDGTDFGGQSVCTGTVVKMYTIHNTSTVPLTVTGITKSGTAANDFTVGGIMLPATVEASGPPMTFTVTFDPSEPGARNAKINIANSDCNEGSYNFAIQGTGDNPEIDVQGNGKSIMDGDGTPSAGNGTNFGSQSVCTGTVVKMYTILNTSNIPLTVTGITKSGTAKDDFTIGGITLPATVEASDPPMTFTVTFDPSELGERNAKIQIANSDCDEATYNFAIQGTGVDNEPPTISCPTGLTALGSGTAGTTTSIGANTSYQSFTANATGQIQNVKVHFNSVSGNVTLNIYSGTPCSGTLIYTQVFTGVTAGYQTLALSSPVSVTNGGAYYFSVTANWTFMWSNNNTYSGGRMYLNGCPGNPDFPNGDINFAVDISSGNTNVSLNSSCQATLPSYTSVATASDNCGAAILSQSPAIGTLLSGTGTQLVTMTATDAAGLTSSCTFNVIKVDNTPPTITCPAPKTVNLNVSCAASLSNYTTLASVGDNCTAAASIVRTQSPAIGTALSGVGVTVVTLIATDGGGKSSTCTFNVNRTDVIVPTITCPPTQSLELGTGCAATLPNYSSLATATDNCTASGSIVKTQVSPAAGSTVNMKGATTVTLRATDASGKSRTCTFTVNKVDNTAPFCGAGPQGYAGGNNQVHALDNQIVEERIEAQVGQEQPFELEMYPNPTDGLVHLVLHGLKSMAEVTVFDPMGRRMVWQQKVDPALNTLTLNMAEKGFAEGLYFVMVRSEGATVTRRLVVAR